MAVSPYVLPFPEIVRIEPSAACNLKCLHCPTGTVAMPRGVMAEQTFELVLSQIRSHTIRVAVLFHSGEPLINNRFPSMTKRVKALGIPFVKTVSNGMLLTDTIIEELIDSGLDLIEISLDGESKAENDFIRRGCDFDMVVGNVKRFIAAKKRRKTNLPKIEITSTLFMSAGQAEPDSAVCPVPAFIANAFEGQTEIDFKPTWAYIWPDLPIDAEVFSADKGTGATVNYCSQVRNNLNVCWNGDVVACCYDLTGKMVLGNIHNDSLETIWNNHAYQALRRSIDEMRFCDMCKNCTEVNPGVRLRLKPGVVADAVAMAAARGR